MQCWRSVAEIGWIICPLNDKNVEFPQDFKEIEKFPGISKRTRNIGPRITQSSFHWVAYSISTFLHFYNAVISFFKTFFLNSFSIIVSVFFTLALTCLSCFLTHIYLFIYCEARVFARCYNPYRALYTVKLTLTSFLSFNILACAWLTKERSLRPDAHQTTSVARLLFLDARKLTFVTRLFIPTHVEQRLRHAFWIPISLMISEPFSLPVKTHYRLAWRRKRRTILNWAPTIHERASVGTAAWKHLVQKDRRPNGRTNKWADATKRRSEGETDSR